MTKSISFHDVTLRDGQQSLAATRMTSKQALRVLPLIEQAGFESIELWGGATLDACVRFLDEDPWERLENFAAALKQPSKIQALLRGQNLFAYQPFPDDLVVSFTKQAIQSGVGTMRIFDALNDRRNLQTAILATRAYGGKAEAAISYTTSPVHTPEYFVQYARDLVEDGADRICIKDMAGLLHPSVAVSLLPALRSAVPIPITLHTHSTTGVSILNALIAMRSGIDSIDTAITPFSCGCSLPPVEILMVFAELMGMEHGLDAQLLQAVQRELFGIARELAAFNPYIQQYYRPITCADVDQRLAGQVLEWLEIGSETALEQALAGCRQITAALNFPPFDDRIFVAQIPGGMLTNLQSQLRDMGAPDAMDAVMKEIPLVRADVGYVPLVTPTSQIVGSQAAFNVIGGSRYNLVSNEFRMLLRGEFGRTPGCPNPDVVQTVLGGTDQPLRYRPAFYLKPLLEDSYHLAYVQSHKDLLLHLMLGQSADDYLKRHRPARTIAAPIAVVDEDELMYVAA
ncbi:MAG: oxaloacetate decarboxylase [Chloroflexi bacterium HGW-Chloroflexi-10]|nr:MAG: oxaloacetate decarboxylase [Chloroflexi bacterium HGW-Chloroflexi-10]